MALILSTTYPTQVTADGAYPYGKPKNKASELDTTGFPWEAKVPQDIFGFLQALLVAGSVTPNGDPDEVGASNYLSALQQVASDVAEVVLGPDIATNAADIDTLEAIVADRLGVWDVPLLMQVNASARFEYYVVQPDQIATTIGQSDVTDAGGIVIPIQLPYPGLRLAANGITVYVQGATGHGGLPGTMPTVGVAVYEASAGATKLGDATDTSATVGAYELVHPITPTFSARNIAANEIVSIRITGETGANALTNLLVHSILATFSATV